MQKQFFVKTPPHKIYDPFEYRVLLILPVLYRRWATARLADLKPWVQRWQLPEMFAGVEGCGAEDGWYETSLTMEHFRLTNTPFAGAASDIYKCFDQINRTLLYHILQIAGMPKNIISAYARYQEGLNVYNSLAAGLGEKHIRLNGIPQGCPLSMMIIALMTRPWMLVTRQCGATPRGLADDLLAIAAGHNHVQNLIKATEETHRFLEWFGAKVATNKQFYSLPPSRPESS